MMVRRSWAEGVGLHLSDSAFLEPWQADDSRAALRMLCSSICTGLRSSRHSSSLKPVALQHQQQWFLLTALQHQGRALWALLVGNKHVVFAEPRVGIKQTLP